MDYLRKLLLELIPVALVAGLGAYVAVQTSITVLTVNQGIILREISEGKKETKEVRNYVQEMDVRLAVVETKQG